jgi:uncharacterized membrane protein YhaH (DUF805 family)
MTEHPPRGELPPSRDPRDPAPATVIGHATTEPVKASETPRSVAVRNAGWRGFLWPDIASERDARRALTIGMVGNAFPALSSVFGSLAIGVILEKQRRTPGVSTAFVTILLIGIVMAWSAYWLRTRQSILAGWIGFCLCAAMPLLMLLFLVASFFSDDRSFGVTLTLFVEFLLIALIAVCSYQGLRGGWWLRQHEVPVPIPKTDFWATLDFVYLYLRFDGRINRKPFIFAGLLLGFVRGAIMPLMTLVAIGEGSPREFALLEFAMDVVLLYPTTALLVKRLHDRNWPGYLAAIYCSIIILQGMTGLMGFYNPFAPNALQYLVAATGLAIGIWLFIELACRRGTIGSNQYGPDPLEGQS